MTQNSTVQSLRILYPIWVILAIISVVAIPSLVYVDGDAIQTAKNLSSNELLFRIGFIGSISTQLLFIIIPLLLYQLFKPVSMIQATLMLAFALISVPITIINEMRKLTAIGFVDDPDVMMRILEMNIQGQIISSIFWGLWLFPLGMLVIKSGFFPSIMGWLLITAGIGYVFNSLGEILTHQSELSDAIFEICTFGEVLFILWFIIKGIQKEDN